MGSNPRGEVPFWERKTLEEMSTQEWESLCDGCGLCCLNKLVDDDDEEDEIAVAFTRVSCHMLDVDTCRCTDYSNRKALVPDCLVLSADEPESFVWLPQSCAYRRLAEGLSLPWWHPLRSGDPESVHDEGISLRGQMISEEYIHPDELVYYIIDLPDDEP